MKAIHEEEDWVYIICWKCANKNPIDGIYCMFCNANLTKSFNRPRILLDAEEILRKKRNV